MLVPLGNGWSVCNLTAKARLELNASRHEINMNRSVIDEWLDKYGTLIQEKVEKNCMNVLKKYNLEFPVNSMLASEVDDDYFSQKSYDNMKKILSNLVNS